MTHNAATKNTKGAVMAPRVLVDEELWFGTFDEASAEQVAANSMAATAGKVIGAKPFPESTRRLAELARSETSKTHEMVEVLEQESGAFGKVAQDGELGGVRFAPTVYVIAPRRYPDGVEAALPDGDDGFGSGLVRL